MSSQEQPSAWNAEPKLGGFVPSEGKQGAEQMSLGERLRRFTDWAFGAALTAPSVTSVGTSEHFHHEPSDQLAA